MTPQEAPILTPAEVAELMRVHVKTVRRWIAVGRLPATHINSRVIRVRRTDVEALMRKPAA